VKRAKGSNRHNNPELCSAPAYYNEIDPKAAAVLRELIKAGHIAPGVVDERSIEDVVPAELVGYTQCHFFAGFGVWSYALRRAGWPDDRAVWTASCPCQPFSAAGKGVGFADERHLWPHLYHLIDQCRPGIVIGEQVASKDANPWLDLVQTDVEALAYAFGAVAFPSAGVGAPHIRDRTYWLANANYTRSQGRGGVLERAAECVVGTGGVAGWMADTPDERFDGRRPSNARYGRDAARLESQRFCDALGLADSRSGRREEHADARRGAVGDRAQRIASGPVRGGGPGGTGPTNGLWRDADWLLCRDGKWRPVEPGTFPLAHGAAARVGRLRGYGNAINAEAAKAFIEAVMETDALSIGRFSETEVSEGAARDKVHENMPSALEE